MNIMYSEYNIVAGMPYSEIVVDTNTAQMVQAPVSVTGYRVNRGGNNTVLPARSYNAKQAIFIDFPSFVFQGIYFSEKNAGTAQWTAQSLSPQGYYADMLAYPSGASASNIFFAVAENPQISWSKLPDRITGYRRDSNGNWITFPIQTTQMSYGGSFDVPSRLNPDTTTASRYDLVIASEIYDSSKPSLPMSLQLLLGHTSNLNTFTTRTLESVDFLYGLQTEWIKS